MEDKFFYFGRMIYFFVMIVNSDRENLYNGMEGKGVWMGIGNKLVRIESERIFFVLFWLMINWLSFW